MRDDNGRLAPPRVAGNGERGGVGQALAAVRLWWRRRRRLGHNRRLYRARQHHSASLPERRPRLAYLFAILPVLMIGSLLASGPFLYAVDNKIDTIFETPVPLPPIGEGSEGATALPIALPNWDKKERVNILLIGVDKREDDVYTRTDTMILVSIDPGAKTVGMLSLPRDLKVTIPKHGQDKLNAAYVYGDLDYGPGGGIRLLQQTIQQNFGVSVPYYGQVDFRGFEKIVDEFGGVNVDPPYPLKDDEYPTETNGYTSLYFPAGLQHLDGKMALKYARTRHPDNDFGRARRQQEVILALRQQAINHNLVATLYTKFFPLLDILAGSVKTNLSKDQSAALVNLGQQVSIKQYSLLTPVALVDECQAPDGDGNVIDYLCATDWSLVRKRVKEMIPNAPESLVLTPTPDPAAKIGVRNGTLRDRFAASSADRLKAAGFAGAVVDAAEAADRPQSATIVYVYGDKLDAALLVARTLGLSEGAVLRATGAAPGGVDILVVLGDDAPTTPPRPTPTPARR